MNLYAYVGNDPINATDPTGMCVISAQCLDFAEGVFSTGRAYLAVTSHLEMRSGTPSQQLRAKAVENTIAIALMWAVENPATAGALSWSTMQERGLVYVGGRVAASALVGKGVGSAGARFISHRGASLAFSIGVSGGNLSATQMGNAIGGVNQVFDEFEAAGIDPGVMGMDQVRDVVAAAIHGADFSYDGETSTLTATYRRAGSRIRASFDIELGDDH